MSKHPFSTGHSGIALNNILLLVYAVCTMLMLSRLDLLYKVAVVFSFQEAHAQMYRMGTKNKICLESFHSFWLIQILDS